MPRGGKPVDEADRQKALEAFQKRTPEQQAADLKRTAKHTLRKDWKKYAKNPSRYDFAGVDTRAAPGGSRYKEGGRWSSASSGKVLVTKEESKAINGEGTYAVDKLMEGLGLKRIGDNIWELSAAITGRPKVEMVEIKKEPGSNVTFWQSISG